MNGWKITSSRSSESGRTEMERRVWSGGCRRVYWLCSARSMIVWAVRGRGDGREVKGISCTISHNLSSVHLKLRYHQAPSWVMIKHWRDPEYFFHMLSGISEGFFKQHQKTMALGWKMGKPKHVPFATIRVEKKAKQTKQVVFYWFATYLVLTSSLVMEIPTLSENTVLIN